MSAVSTPYLGPLQRQLLDALSSEWRPTRAIAADINRETNNVHRSLKSLIDRELCERRIDPTNPKGYRYRLTDDGVSVAQEADRDE